MPTRRVLWLAVLACMMLPMAVRADVAILLEAESEQPIADRDVRVVENSARDFFAEKDIPVVEPHLARERLGADYTACSRPACAPDSLKALGADFAVALRLYAHEEMAEVGSVSVAIVDPGGVTYASTFGVVDSALVKAVRKAVLESWEKYKRGPGPWLNVEGPDGAMVVVDGKPHGLTPYVGRIEAGLHRVQVTANDGSILHNAAIRIPDQPAHYGYVNAGPEGEELAEPSDVPDAERGMEAVAASEPARANAVAVTTASSAPRSDDPVRTEVHWSNYLAGGGLVAIGAAVMVGPAISMAREGQCVDGGVAPPPPASCEGYVFDGTQKALLGVGAVAAAAGLVVLAWRPIRLGVEAGAQRTMLRVSGAF